jgi:dCMP deaminase
MRPDPDAYFMGIASEVMRRCNCLRHAVGAVIVVDGLMVSSGYNGTARGHENCMDGGCERCATDPESGSNYDTCVCVHAEQNAFIAAAKHGVSLRGGKLYTTRRPCFSCLKEAIQAGIAELFYVEDWQPAGAGARGVYRRYEDETKDFMRIVPLANPELVAQVQRRVRDHDANVIEHLLTKSIDRAGEKIQERAREIIGRANAAEQHERRIRLYRTAADVLNRSQPWRRSGHRALDLFFLLDPSKWSMIAAPSRRASRRRSRTQGSRRARSGPRSRERGPGRAHT